MYFQTITSLYASFKLSYIVCKIIKIFLFYLFIFFFILCAEHCTCSGTGSIFKQQNMSLPLLHGPRSLNQLPRVLTSLA